MDRDIGFDPEIYGSNHDWWEMDVCLQDAIDRDLAALKTCDGIYMLRGWELSRGARAEKALAEWMGLQVAFQVPPTGVKLFVLGHGRHGKDTVAEMILERTGLTFNSSSYHVCERLIWPACQAIGRYASIEECYADRHNRRAEWYDHITMYNTPDRARLSREIFAEHDIYVGIRNRDEFVEAKNVSALAIWVDASKRKPPEPASSMTILREDADIVIDNNGDLDALKRNLEPVIEMLEHSIAP